MIIKLKKENHCKKRCQIGIDAFLETFDGEFEYLPDGSPESTNWQIGLIKK